MRFYVGLHQPSDARHFLHQPVMISVNRLTHRKRLAIGPWLLDSGAFTEVARHGGYRTDVHVYAREIVRVARFGQLDAAVAQDFMCEPFVLTRTGMSVRQHQALTIGRYDELRWHQLPVPILPVLQGFAPTEYADHVRQYGDRLARGAWVGVGSVCKRNTKPQEIAAVLRAIKQTRPDLRLHGFGIKLTALKDVEVRAYLWSTDSMAWSFSARRQGRSSNDWREAAQFAQRVQAILK